MSVSPYVYILVFQGKAFPISDLEVRITELLTADPLPPRDQH